MRKDKIVEKLFPERKIQVFVSSKCGTEKYDSIRAELKKLIEDTGFASVYLFEDTGASSLTAGNHYLWALEESDICIFLIDNYDGIPAGVEKEIDLAQKIGKKALYYFCDENSTKKTILEQKLRGATNAKSKTVHTFDALLTDSAHSLINEITNIYHFYCIGKLVTSIDEQEVPHRQINASEISEITTPIYSNTLIKNVDKCKKFLFNFVAGYQYPVSSLLNEKEKTSNLDDWAEQFLHVLFAERSIKNFNLTIFLQELKQIHNIEQYNVIELRWSAVQEYLLGDVESCIGFLRKALTLAKDTNQPIWLIKDILIDLRNQEYTYCSISGEYRKSLAQEELDSYNEEVFYPVLDRTIESIQGIYIKGMLNHINHSPFSVTYTDDEMRCCEYLANAYVVSMCNGSLTHIILMFERLKELSQYMSSIRGDWTYRCNMLMLTVSTGNQRETKKLLESYPEIEIGLTENDANKIMRFCHTNTISHKFFVSQLVAFGAVGYYLSDIDFELYENEILKGVNEWASAKNVNTYIGDNVFNNLEGVAHRLSQDTLAEICCVFIKNGYCRWYIDMFKFLIKYVDINRMNSSNAKHLIDCMELVFNDENQRKCLSDVLDIFIRMRNQNRLITQKLDAKIGKYFPDFYNGSYKKATSEASGQEIAALINKYTQYIKEANNTQSNRHYAMSSVRYIAAVENIMISERVDVENKLFDSLISTVADTILISAESIVVKVDAISLLICVALKYPEVYTRNKELFEKIHENRGEIDSSRLPICFNNVNQTSLKIALQFLFTAMGYDTYADIIELMPYVYDDDASIILISDVVSTYLRANTCMRLPQNIEAVVLQNTLQWLQSRNTDIRRNATLILLYLCKNPENEAVANHTLQSLTDSDNARIKNTIMRNLFSTSGITDDTRSYIISKYRNDPNYLVRMVCKQEMDKHATVCLH